MVKDLLEDFNYDLQRIPRKENSWLDALAKLASAKATVNNRIVIQEILWTPNIDNVMNIEERESWMRLIVHYLKGASC